jgi:hypothetical protein
MSTLSRKSPLLLSIYNHCLLKTAIKADVEGMRKVVGKQVDKGRGLNFGSCGMCIFMSLISMHSYSFLLFIMFAYLQASMQTSPNILKCALAT